MSRTLVIGDVHGCCAEAHDLLAACGHRDGDQVVFVGDLVAKGPDSRAVLALVRELGARAVLGNHDAAVLRVHEAREHGQRPAPALKATHLAAAASLDSQDWALLRSLPLYLRLPEHDAMVVHAGLVPGVPLCEQTRDVLLSARSIRPDGSPSKRLDDGVPWASLWPGPELVLFGHDARRGLQRYPHAIGLDTGCVYGKQLSACVLPDREIVSVPARAQYVAPGA